jgi:O-antigen biosynthesis protein
MKTRSARPDLEQRIRELEAEIAQMKTSKFWKLRNRYVRVKSFRPRVFFSLIGRAIAVWRQYGSWTVARYFFLYLRHGRAHFQQNRTTVDDYSIWQQENETYDEDEVQTEIEQWSVTPTVSVCVPVYNAPVTWLDECVQSVVEQWYPHWELCLYDDASTETATIEYLRALEKNGDSRIRVIFGKENRHISEATNAAAECATGEYIGLLDNDDTIAPWALFEVVRTMQVAEEMPKILYSDEDKLTEEGVRRDPFFKPEWSPETILSIMYTSHFSVYDTQLYRELGGLREGFEGAQDYDLILRASERVKESEMVHIPAVLYHWRAVHGSTAQGVHQKSYAHENGKKALEAAVKRRGWNATVQDGHGFGRYRVQFVTPDPAPRVSIIIPFRDKVQLLKQCVDSVLEKTDYPNYEIILVNNDSVEPEMLAYLNKMREHENIRILDYPHPFNYSAINNFAVRETDSPYILLLNNDTEVISREWLSAMMEHAQRDEIGAVGALLLFENGMVQHAGVVLGIGGVAGHAFKYLNPETPGYFSQLRIVRNVSAVTGACLLTRREIFTAVGGLDEKNLAVAFNDVDLCLRIHSAGYRIVYTPYARLYHYESISRGNDDELYKENPEKYARVKKEFEFMRKRWGNQLFTDPCYSPHLSLVHEDYRIRINEDARMP